MAWEVVYTDEFESWWNGLTEDEQISVNRKVLLLMQRGPSLPRPHADVLHSSQFPNMKELRIQHEGRPYRVLFIFDPQRNAVLLIGGDKTGNDRWYEEYVPKAETIYRKYLEERPKLNSNSQSGPEEAAVVKVRGGERCQPKISRSSRQRCRRQRGRSPKPWRKQTSRKWRWTNYAKRAG